jgi:TonB family protein
MIAFAMATLLAVSTEVASRKTAEILVLVVSGRPDTKANSTRDPSAEIDPGTVLLSGASSSATARERQKLFSALQESYRLEPLEPVHTEQLHLAVDETKVLTLDRRPTIEITLLRQAPFETYRVRLKRGDGVLAEPVVALKPRGRAVVGTRDGEEYLFIVLESEGALGPDAASFARAPGKGVDASATDEVAEHPAHPPRVIKAQRAVYASVAARANVHGRVILQVLIDRTGKVRDARFIRKITHPLGQPLNEEALTAVRGSQYAPATDADGKPVTAWFEARVNF